MTQVRLLFITARKRSLGQDNVFTPVCDSFCSRVCRCYDVTSCYRQDPPPDGQQPTPTWTTPPPPWTAPTPPPPTAGQQAGGTHPTEILSCLK